MASLGFPKRDANNEHKALDVMPHHGLPSNSLERHYNFAQPPAPGSDPGDGFAGVLWSRKWTIALVTLACGAAGFLLSVPQTPVYQAQISIEIDSVNETFLRQQNVAPNVRNSSTDSYVQTQLDVIQSRALLRRVISKLDLAKRVDRFGTAGGFSGLVRKATRRKTAEPLTDDGVLREVMANLKVRTAPPTRIIRISFEATDPKLASDVANTVATEYAIYSVESRRAETESTGRWLNGQLGGLKQKLSQSEHNLQSYMLRSGILFTGEDKSNVAKDRLKQLQEELSRAEGDRTSKDAEYEVAVANRPESLPRVQDNQLLMANQTRLAELKRQLAELSHSMTPEHYKVQRVKAQIADLESELDKGRGNIVTRLRNEAAAAVTRERSLRDAFYAQARVVAEQNAKTVEYDMLKHEVDADRAAYDALLERAREAGVVSALRSSNVHTIDAAEPPMSPFKPNHLMNGVLGLMGGLFLSMGFVLVRHGFNRKIQRPGEAIRYSRLPELGAIPYTRSIGDDGGMLDDSVRATLASLVLGGKHSAGPKVIVVTSPGAGEGKTTIVRNLGRQMAEICGSVLLVDADLRRPRLHTVFERSNKWGLVNLLEDTFPVEDYPIEAFGAATETPGLFLLPSGELHEDSPGLFYGPRVRDILERLRREYAVVLIDTPPMLDMPDARLLGSLSDGVVLVFRSSQTTIEAAGAAAARFRADGTPVLGTILNSWNPARSAYNAYRSRQSSKVTTALWKR